MIFTGILLACPIVNTTFGAFSFSSVTNCDPPLVQTCVHPWRDTVLATASRTERIPKLEKSGELGRNIIEFAVKNDLGARN